MEIDVQKCKDELNKNGYSRLATMLTANIRTMIGFPTDVLSSICHLFSILSAFFYGTTRPHLTCLVVSIIFIRQLMIPIDNIFICSIFFNIHQNYRWWSSQNLSFFHSFTMFSPKKMKQISELRPLSVPRRTWTPWKPPTTTWPSSWRATRRTCEAWRTWERCGRKKKEHRGMSTWLVGGWWL